ncbi:MAG TPA: GNAT family N-acetyltransferase [Candidatus Saccharimonadia bacterium]|nr:GNAT family N-acetyltransferase [Candidatus Saccharimonadia bacterium]
MPNLANTTIQTERLKLIPVVPKYAPSIFQEFTPVLTTYMFPKAPTTIDDTMQFITTSEAQLKSGEAFNVTILHRVTGEFLGGGGISSLNTNAPELGIWIKLAAHGHKYGREAVHGLKDWAREHLTYDYLIYPVDRRNTASRKIAESLGGIVKKDYPRQTQSGSKLDIVEYHIATHR